MSTEIQELIYKTTMIAVQQGVKTERERVLHVLEALKSDCIKDGKDEQLVILHRAVQQIKEGN